MLNEETSIFPFRGFVEFGGWREVVPLVLLLLLLLLG